MDIVSKKEIEAFFNLLIDECSKEEVYSVIETTEKMGVSYQQVQDWAKSNNLEEVLDICRSSCKCNARKDWRDKKIPEETAIKYICENDDEFKAFHELRKSVELREKLEKEGKEIPPTQTLETVIEEDKSECTAPQEPVEKSPVRPLAWQKTWWENREKIEAERVEQFRKKWAQENVPLEFEQTYDKKKNRTFLHRSTMKDQSSIEDYKLLTQSIMLAAFGSASGDCVDMLFSQTINAQFFDRNNADAAKNGSAIIDAAKTSTATINTLVAMNPKDIIEGQLCSRLMVLHNQYMNFLCRVANPEQTEAGVDLNINRGTKLMRIYNETLEALNRHRRKGEQKVIVQHVNVGNGGKAIVAGSVDQGGGDHGKK